jgi:prepilin-type N-terminal cleavage/methylation domain-containing protein
MVRGQWSVVRGQWSRVSGQGSGVSGQGSGVRGQGSVVRGQGSGVSPACGGTWISERSVQKQTLKTSTGAGFGRCQRQRGFTLVELLVVMVIIAIILGFVLLAASDAARRAEERATQTLITKLEGGLNDRLDALMQNRPDVNWAHGYMAAVWNGTYTLDITQVRTADRAQVFAWYDYLKRELPDVFFIQSDTNYPINFAAAGFPGTPTVSGLGTYSNFMLPIGNSVVNNPTGGSYGDSNIVNSSFVSTNPLLGLSGSGIFGASYPIAAGLFKNMPGVQPNGFDGVDSSNPPNTLIDEIGEGQWDLATFTRNHTHASARSEMLYAILVEGVGPWGSVFSRDEFTDREVQDTDGDGLPEFVDAWGQPLQFFRWPLLYHSELQRGQVILTDPSVANQWDLVPPYQSVNTATPAVNMAGAVFQERERDILDPNQQLTAPQWWSQAGVNGQLAANNSSPFTGSQAGTVGASGGVQIFENFFHRLTEPISPGGGVLFWDRGASFARRAYYSKFLILSGGPDKQPGVFLYADSDMQALGDNAASFLIANENNAMPFGMDMLGGGTAGFTTTVTIPTGTGGGNPFFTNTSSNDPTHPSTYDLRQSAQDDISNHNLQAVSGIGGSG